MTNNSSSHNEISDNGLQSSNIPINSTETLFSHHNRTRRNQQFFSEDFIQKLNTLHSRVLETGIVTSDDLHAALRTQIEQQNPNRINLWIACGVFAFIFLATPVVYEVVHFLLGVRCFVPNNYLVWEATRPISDCRFCSQVKGPLILQNLTREEFSPFAYSSQPIIIKNAVGHWPAKKILNFTFLRDLYLKVPGALEEDCQFLHFRSDFMTLREVFQMSDARSKFTDGYPPWYVGWSNCHPVILEELRKLYPRPHFLPEDAEMPNTDYIFLGYEQGAIMHLDYIPRLMWQAQLQGNKSWVLAPTPECDQICHSFSFYVEPGDAVLVDTRIWYHGTSIPKGQFALTIQSEYG
ncbi:uncharacterized protein LOC129610094 [Condylostylus longicornis]|uniref:uncharacterized protein LOC129610094 n=1 Tax=Condylostylus longicornis TaxID=2530218 RepID=UPI00244E22DA|nr:uncharacterized protein LOC129610094 [Condylostylus longicornis]